MIWVLLAFVRLAYAEAEPSKKIKQSLTLNDAILLAVRTNPNVQQSQLSYLMQKFNLHVQEWQFQPHYSFQAGVTQTRANSSGSAFSNSQNWNAQPAVSLQTPIGTQVTLAANNTNADNYNPGLSLQIMQPLMRGFGTAVVESSLNNAKDSTIITKLNVEGTLRSTITAVINAYLDVVTAEKTISIDEEALKRAQKSVEQTRQYIQGGHKAGN
jgi:outer membrane protein TolC